MPFPRAGAVVDQQRATKEEDIVTRSLTRQPRRWPDPIGEGSVVAMIAPSGPLKPERISFGVEQLQSWGLRVQQGKHLADTHRDLSYLAGTDADRAADFMAAWLDPEVNAIWCGRGGYGAQRMVDLLDFDQLRAAGPKHLIGFSDITALHARIGRELEQVTVHGPVSTGEHLLDPPSADSIRRLVFKRPGPGLELLRGETLVPGTATGRLIGGNLALIAADLGIEPLPSEPSVVILEDVGEKAYRLDNLLTQLRRIGWFSSVTAIVLGDFTESDDDELAAVTVAERVSDLGIPVLSKAKFGHGDRNLAVPLGATVELDAGAGTLTLAE